MSAARPGLAHLIGSVPLATTEGVFRRLSAALGSVLSRMPDGETGERRRWIYWQRTELRPGNGRFEPSRVWRVPPERATR